MQANIANMPNMPASPLVAFLRDRAAGKAVPQGFIAARTRPQVVTAP
jgi:hypothetical protein